MTPLERNLILERAMDLLEVVDCLVQSVTKDTCDSEDVYDIHNGIQNIKDDIAELTASTEENV